MDQAVVVVGRSRARCTPCVKAGEERGGAGTVKAFVVIEDTNPQFLPSALGRRVVEPELLSIKGSSVVCQGGGGAECGARCAAIVGPCCRRSGSGHEPRFRRERPQPVAQIPWLERKSGGSARRRPRGRSGPNLSKRAHPPGHQGRYGIFPTTANQHSPACFFFQRTTAWNRKLSPRSPRHNPPEAATPAVHAPDLSPLGPRPVGDARRKPDFSWANTGVSVRLVGAGLLPWCRSSFIGVLGALFLKLHLVSLGHDFAPSSAFCQRTDHLFVPGGYERVDCRAGGAKANPAGLLPRRTVRHFAFLSAGWRPALWLLSRTGWGRWLGAAGCTLARSLFRGNDIFKFGALWAGAFFAGGLRGGGPIPLLSAVHADPRHQLLVGAGHRRARSARWCW